MIPDDQETAKLRAAFAAAAGPAPDPESCPAPEAILAAVRDELPRGETRAIVDHTATCPSCAEDWRLAMAFEESEPAARPIEPRYAPAARPWRRARLAPYAAAAAAAAVLLLAVQLPKVWKTGDPAMRGVPTETIQELIPERLPRKDCRLKWTERPGATYDVEVYNSGTGEQVASAKGLVKPEYLIDERDLQDIPAGTRLAWQVTATLSRGNQLLLSEPSENFSFILK